MERQGKEGSSSPRATSIPEREQRRLALAEEIAEFVLAEGLGDLGLRGLAHRLGTSGRMLLYYFVTKEQLVIDVLDRIEMRLGVLLAQHISGPPVSAGQFLAKVLELARDPEVAPFVRLWTEVIARGARGEPPYDRVAAKVVTSWLGWIDSRLAPTGKEILGRTAALLSVVEGATLLEMACPGSTAGMRDFLVEAFEYQKKSVRGRPARARL
jgi:AcrR family transcriptional regulator